MDFYNEKLGLNVPEHIAIILDGNGRWAKKRFLPRNAGHLQGSRVLERICDELECDFGNIISYDRTKKS